MKFKLMAKTIALFQMLLSWSEVPIEASDNKLKINASERQKIIDALGSEELADKAINGINTEIANMANSNLEMKAIQDEIDAMVRQSQLSEDELKNATNDDGQPDTVALLKAISLKQKEQDALLKKITNEAIGNLPEQIIEMNQNSKIVHSATHLFSSKEEYDAFDGRNWNRRAAGQTTVATDFNSQPAINKLNDDLGLFFRQNPDMIKSLQRDRFGLPSFWPKRTKVDDKVADGFISTAEISQARKLNWLPKNKQKIEAEEGQIFPVQIDIEFVGYWLQKIEASWLNMMNNEGSQPYKNSFVRFLVSELDKKARIEDRIAEIKGIYVKTPENATEAGRFINRQNGLLYLIYKAREIDKKYRPFDLGMPTPTNIVDYIDKFIKSLPFEVREEQGLVLYLSDEWLRTYKRRYELLYGLNEDYMGYPETPKDYPNIKFERLVDLAGSDFMFITFDDNIEILENIPSEKSMYHFEYLKRMIYIWADYKLGIRLRHIGSEVIPGDPLEFQVQTIWSNTAPIFTKDTFVPAYDDESGNLKITYKNTVIQKDWKTNITNIKNVIPGQILKIKGNNLPIPKSVIKNTDLLLASDFDLSTGGTLTLLVLPDLKFKEISRTTAPEMNVIPNVILDTDLLDANDGVKFIFQGTEDITLLNIDNGVEGKTISIFGNNTTKLTINTIANIKTDSEAILAKDTDTIDFILIDGIWTETKRTIQ